MSGAVRRRRRGPSSLWSVDLAPWRSPVTWTAAVPRARGGVGHWSGCKRGRTGDRECRWWFLRGLRCRGAETGRWGVGKVEGQEQDSKLAGAIPLSSGGGWGPVVRSLGIASAFSVGYKGRSAEKGHKGIWRERVRGMSPRKASRRRNEPETTEW